MKFTSFFARTALAAGLVASLSAGVMRTAAAAEEVILYHALDFADPVVKAFTAKTGIEVKNVAPGGTGELLGKVAAEGSNPQFDLVWFDGSAVMERMLADKVLQPIPDALFAKADYTDVGKKLVPASHAFLPTSVSTTAITVNTKRVPADKMPKSFADLANPEFVGFIGAKDPNLSGPFFQFVAGLFQVMGEEKGKTYLKTILTNKKMAAFASGGGLNKALLTGDAKVGFAQDSSTFAKMAKGEPLTVVYPTEGVVALPAGIGMGAKAPHPAAAAKFIEFLLSPEGQAAMQDGDDTDYFLIPILKGIAAKPGRKIDVNFIYLDGAAAGAKEAEWKKWYKDNFVP